MCCYIQAMNHGGICMSHVQTWAYLRQLSSEAGYLKVVKSGSQVGQKRGPYYCFTQEEQAKICKYTAYHTTILNITNACAHNQTLPIM